MADAALGDVLWENSSNVGHGSSGIGINLDHWTHAEGDGCDAPAGCGWGNQELQTYTSDLANVNVKGGHVQIAARRTSHSEEEDDGNLPMTAFTSCRIHTRGKVQFQYGTLEARIKLPATLDAGVWPALSTLGADWPTVAWPKSGEIDVLEMGSGSAIMGMVM